ncbi:heterokaryon incompatibility protein-domain-containing protein [Achaetomium macrosporum]|uniref:Heterokaryon incompatibility protein-domain-containing protein n=1 Tax=Achaetomium macrosporum TaxID=79813 RepID=A0AAN7C4E1_9PEZI|nr:heterokaryon incompatibility protein-domain-containing protein [Achaetomium macrosporum]
MPPPRSRPRSHSNPPPRRRRPAYTYTPLSTARHIRLLQLVHFDPALSQLYATLTEHPISAIAHQFTALTSFETFKRRDDLAGSEGGMIDVYTPDVRTLAVRGNLAGFLRSYFLGGYPDGRMRDHKSGKVVWSFEVISRLWVDAVCIDQTNAEEKACQIPLMGEVYNSAGRVLAWLGADESRLGTFLWWHRVVMPAVVRAVKRDGDVAMAKFRDGNYRDGALWRDVVGIENPAAGSWSRAWTDYWAFYRTRRYFHRAWIVQEVAVAGRFDMMAGPKGDELSWDDMLEFAYFLGRVGWVAELDDLGDRWLSTLGRRHSNVGQIRGFGITDIGTLQQEHRNKDFEKTGWPEHWWAVLTAVRRRDCFVKQDKVFATVGTLQQALPPGTPLPFPVDATATPEEVYIHAATALLLNCPKLPLLSFVDHPHHRSLSNLPSWVPDLTTARYACPIGSFDSGFTACVLDSSPNIPPRYVAPAGELHLRGVKLDTISYKTQYCPPWSTALAVEALSFLASMPVWYPHAVVRDEEGPKPMFREVALIHVLTCNEFTNPYRGSEAESWRLLNSFRTWLVMALGLIYSGCLVREGEPWYSAETLAECKAKWEAIEALIRGLGARGLVPAVEEVKEHGEHMMRARRGEQPWPESVTSPQVFKYQIGFIMLYRCLFRTGDGWVGVCTETCEAGDEVWLLQGGAVPYVLRPCKEEGGKRKYLFCGECCVEGVMKGELVESGYAVADKLEDVVIR